jgi:hypothetical protein
MTTSQHSGWFSGRTRIITVVSMIAIGVTGAVAIGANVGILNAASSTKVGTVTAADLTTPNTQTVDVYLPSTTALSSTAAAGVQDFAVDAAGSVAVAATASGIRLDSVTPAAGWTWSLSQSGPQQLTVTLTNGVRTLEFVATQNADGTVSAGVNEPVIAPAAATNVPSAQGAGGEHEGGGADD